MSESKFQRLAGLHVYCMLFHSGQGSRLYRILCRIGFNTSDAGFKAIQKRIGPAREEWMEANSWYRAYRDAGKKRNHI